MSLTVRITSASQPAARRDASDDRVLVDDEVGFALVARQLGDPDAGSDAAKAAVEAARARLRASAGDDPATAMKEAFAAAHRAVQALSGERKVMLAAAKVTADPARVTVAHVGVVRAYLLRAGETSSPSAAAPRYVPEVKLQSGARFTCLTRDHSTVCSLVERGHLDIDKVDEHPLRDSLSRTLGGPEEIEPDVVTVESAGGDRLMICSQGVWRAIEGTRLAKMVENAGSAAAGCKALVRAAAQSSAVVMFEWQRVLQPEGGPGDERKKSEIDALIERIGRDLSALARDDELDPVIGRKEEIRRLSQVLLQRQKSNALLIGEAGVGKTRCVEGLAQRIASPQATRALRSKRIVEVSMAALVAGCKYRGEFEERMQALVGMAEKDPNLVLFIDEFHTVMGAGGSGEAMDAANILKPALARGTLRVIGATTNAEYDRHIARDAAFARRFETVYVEEPTADEAKAVLEGLRPKLEGHHGIRISDAAIAAAVELSLRYMPERRLPDKAVDLVDQACARQLVQSLGPQSVRSQADAQPPAEEIGRAEVAAVVADRARVPIDLVMQDDQERLRALPDYLGKRVFGQRAAIEQIVRALRRAYGGLRDPRKPVASFLFVGKTGVGKTEMARTLCEYLFVRPESLVRLDMTEYGEKHNVSRLIGAPPGYVGHDNEGALTGPLRHRPASMVLLDEIDKAHPDVLQVLLQILDEGRLTDGRGQRVSFREAIVVMTSNVEPESARVIGFKRGEAEAEDGDGALRKSLARHFRAELLGRVGAVVRFDPLDADAVRAIADKCLASLLERLSAQQRRVTVPEGFLEQLLANNESAAFGARDVEKQVADAVAKLVDRS